MDWSKVLTWRLYNQQIVTTKFKNPEQVVAWMGAMQAQDFAMAKWAIGLRIPGMKETDIEEAFNKGKILRTHVLRPTWHFVVPSDIGWMLELTRPHIIRLLAYNDRRVGLTKRILTKTNDVLAKALQGGNVFTRDELRAVLQKEKIATDGLRFIHIMMHAELAGIVCSGPRRGKQFTYALLDERARNATTMDHAEALAELTKRYFASHGPATFQDFAWWSGLSMTAARRGMDMVTRYFKKGALDGKEYFFKSPSIKEFPVQGVFLLPNYDEYTVAYRDRARLIHNKHSALVTNRGDTIFNNTIIVNGKVEGTWGRLVKDNSVVVEAKPFLPFSRTTQRSLIKVAKRYSEFIGKSLK
jgi:hypothetical protein